MRIFLSWSGERSKIAALAIRKWLPFMLQNVHPWMSERDIDAGKRWTVEVGEQLATTHFGIIVVTQDNLNAPWLLFESGAISKALPEASVVPYLVDLEFRDLVGPLAQFQAKRATRESTYELINAVNASTGSSPPLELERLDASFNAFWPQLELDLAKVPPLHTPAKLPSSDEVMEDLVANVRGVAKDLRLALDRLETKRPPAIDILVEGTFTHFESGQQITFEPSRDIVEEVANIAGVLVEDYSRTWELLDPTRKKALTQHDGLAYAYRGRRSRLRLVLRSF